MIKDVIKSVVCPSCTWLGGIGGGGGIDVDGAPSALSLTVISDTQIDLSWTNGSTNEDGISIEQSTDGVTYTRIATVAAGVAVYSNTGLTENTLYYYRVRAFKGLKYSAYADSANGTTLFTWTYNMLLSFLTINNHATWTNDQKAKIYDRLNEDYVVTTFGEAGLNKTVCDFFIFFETFANTRSASTTSTKTGATLRWNYGNGNIYTQNAMPAQVSTTEISITSTDGFGGVTAYVFYSGQFRNNIPAFPYYFPNVTNFGLNGGTVSSGSRLKGDITNWGFWKSTMTSFSLTEHDVIGDLTNWVIPNGMRSPNLKGNRYLTGSTPSYSASWAGSGASVPDFSGCRFIGIGGTAFPTTRTYSPNLSNNYFSTAAIDDYISRLDDWYSAHTPQGSVAPNLTGVYNGTITGGDTNTDLVHLKGVFVAAGLTFTPTYNADTYLLTPLDKPTLVLTTDDDYFTDYSKLLPMLNARGKAATSFRYGEWKGSGHQTIAEVNALITSGWDIAAHPEFTSGMDESAIRAVMTDLQIFFTANSIPMFNHCSYSGGYYNALVQSIILDYVELARASGAWDATPNTSNRGMLIYKDNDKTALLAMSLDSLDAIKVAGIKSKLDEAKVKSAACILYNHYVTDADVINIADIVDYAIAQGFDVVNMDGLYAKITA